MQHLPRPERLIRIKNELHALDDHSVEVNGKILKPSQCYHVGVSPAHIIFNTNCPEAIKQQVQAILDKYIKEDENRSQ